MWFIESQIASFTLDAGLREEVRVQRNTASAHLSEILMFPTFQRTHFTFSDKEKKNKKQDHGDRIAAAPTFSTVGCHLVVCSRP
jgi:hypothetical protein